MSSSPTRSPWSTIRRPRSGPRSGCCGRAGVCTWSTSATAPGCRPGRGICSRCGCAASASATGPRSRRRSPGSRPRASASTGARTWRGATRCCTASRRPPREASPRPGLASPDDLLFHSRRRGALGCRAGSGGGMTSGLEVVVEGGNILGEGILWNEADGRLWWTDIESSRLFALEPRSGRLEAVEAPERVGSFAPRRDGKGFLAAFASGFALWDPATGERHDLHAFEEHQPTTRLNDGKTDRQGRFVAGGFDVGGGGRHGSSVGRVDPDLTVTELFDEVGCANGLCFSPDGRTMYFADSTRAEIWAFGYDGETGTLGERRTLAALKGRRPGVPDGSCVDEEGCVWSAEWDGSAVVRWTPEGEID